MSTMPRYSHRYIHVVWSESHAKSAPNPSRDWINGNNEVCILSLYMPRVTVRNSWNSAVNQDGATTIFVGLFMFSSTAHNPTTAQVSLLFVSCILPTYPSPPFIRSLYTTGRRKASTLFCLLFATERNAGVIGRQGIRKRLKSMGNFEH